MARPWIRKKDALITNVADANKLACRDETKTQIVAQSKQHKWKLIHLPIQSSGDPFFIIQLESGDHWAYVAPDPRENPEILFSSSDATIWRIGYSEEKDKAGHYIYPATHTDLFWGLDDSGTTVILRKDRTDKKNLWSLD